MTAVPDGFTLQRSKDGKTTMLRRERPILNKHSVRVLTGQRRRVSKAERAPVG